MMTGAGYEAAIVSIILKTTVLRLIMVTGAIWEKVVFGSMPFLRLRSSGKTSLALPLLRCIYCMFSHYSPAGLIPRA